MFLSHGVTIKKQPNIKFVFVCVSIARWVKNSGGK